MIYLHSFNNLIWPVCARQNVPNCFLPILRHIFHHLYFNYKLVQNFWKAFLLQILSSLGNTLYNPGALLLLIFCIFPKSAPYLPRSHIFSRLMSISHLLHAAITLSCLFPLSRSSFFFLYIQMILLSTSTYTSVQLFVLIFENIPSCIL